MKSFNIFIEKAANKVGVQTSRWKTLNYRYGWGGGYRNGHESNGDSTNNGGDYSNGNGNGGNGGSNGGVGGGGGLGESFVMLPLEVEIPQTHTEFQMGLMFRESLAENGAMLFVFDSTDHHSFHMKNTTIPLDIAFINEEGIVEEIMELLPLHLTPITSESKVRYALEVNHGWFEANNVNPGDKILKCGDD